MAPLIIGPTVSDAPTENVVHKKSSAKNVETLYLGPIKMEILEDGSTTDNRVGILRAYVPPNTPGPIQHWHQMHDETFYILKGTATFYSRDAKSDAPAGDLVVVPPHSPHSFGNEGEEEMVFLNTFTPAYYINYFRLLSEIVKKGPGKLTPSVANRAMLQYATIHIPKEHDWSDKDQNPGKDPKNFGI